MSKQSIIYLAGDRLVLVQGKPGAKNSPSRVTASRRCPRARC